MLYEVITHPGLGAAENRVAGIHTGAADGDSDATHRITSYNVCYTKLLRDAAHGREGDVDAGHVGGAVPEGIDDGRGRREGDVIGGGGDVPHPHVASLFRQGDETIGQHIDVAAAQDVGDAEHADLDSYNFV